MPREITPPQLPQMPNLEVNGKLIFSGLIGLMLLIGAFTSMYQVPTESVYVVQRFGRFKEIAQPGLRFKIPFGVDSVQEVPILRQLKQEFGFGTRGATNVYQFTPDPYMQEKEKNMVTGDLNASQVEWVVQYGISDPQAFLFKVRSPDKTLRDVSESVMREVVGDRTVDEVLTIGRQEIENEAITKLKEVVIKLDMGLRVEQVQLIDVHPPAPVQRSFDDVNRAQQEREQTINMANGEYNKVVPKARGEADQKISEAEGYAVKRVNEAEGDVARFKALLTQYEKAPDVTRQRLYLETMSTVIPQLGSKVILDDSAKQFLPLLQMQQPKIQSPRPAQR